MNRKRHRRYRAVMHRKHRSSKTGGMKKSAVLAAVVVCMSVVAGYMTATYLLGPVIGLEAQPSFFEKIKIQENKKTEKNSEDIKSVKNDSEKAPETESGFALQYGSFSNRSGAEECKQQLEKAGIDAEIIEKEGSFKVIGPIFETKEEARIEKERSALSEEIFVTDIP